MPKKLINVLKFILLYFTLIFYSISHSAEILGNPKIQLWIEGTPILSSLIENKRDVVEFDSSVGKIISISFDIKNLSKKQILSFYRNFFEEKNWKKIKDKNVWKTNNKGFNKKIFKIENIKDGVLTIKIIVENF